MRDLNHLFESNKAWAGRNPAAGPGFFLKLSRQQSPTYLWSRLFGQPRAGERDCRVAARESCYVHRNVANIVVHTGPELSLRDAICGDILKGVTSLCAGITAAAAEWAQCSVGTGWA